MTNRRPARERPGAARGVAERFVVPLKPGNAGGGKGPQFKTDARRSEGPGDWATYQLRTAFRNCRRRCTQADAEKQREGPKHQNRDKDPEDTAEPRDLQRHQQSRLLDHAVVLVRRRQSLLLRVRLRLERREKVAHGLRVGQRHRDGEQIGVGLSASPECRIAL